MKRGLARMTERLAAAGQGAEPAAELPPPLEPAALAGFPAEAGAPAGQHEQEEWATFRPVPREHGDADRPLPPSLDGLGNDPLRQSPSRAA